MACCIFNDYSDYMKKTLYFSLAYLLMHTAVVAQNFVHKYAGTGKAGFINGTLAEAKFSSPFGMCSDAEGNLYIADNGNNCIRKISKEGMVSTFAGAKTAGLVDGTLMEARFKAPTGICSDAEGNFYVADFENHCIRKISKDGRVSTLAGNGKPGFADGKDTNAQFNYPRGICRDAAGNLYIGDSWNHRIRKVSPDGTVSTYAGGGDTIGVQSVGHYKDASDTTARFYTPCEVKVDVAGNVYVADAYNHRIRKISPDRMVSTVAGSGGIGQQEGGFANGPAATALFKVPTTIMVSPSGNLYVGDGANQRVRKISPEGMVSTFAGSGDTGFEDGVDSLASFNFPRAVVEAANGAFWFVVDFNNHSIRRIGPEPLSVAMKQDAELSVYPNPAREFLKISGFKNASSLRMLDLLGREVRSLSLQKGEETAELQVSGLPSGWYTIQVTAESLQYTGTVLITGK